MKNYRSLIPWIAFAGLSLTYNFVIQKQSEVNKQLEEIAGKDVYVNSSYNQITSSKFLGGLHISSRAQNLTIDHDVFGEGIVVEDDKPTTSSCLLQAER